MRVVVDTNVLVSAMRSNRGAAFQLIRRVGLGSFEVAISVPLVLEYEDALGRPHLLPPFRAADVATIVDYLCSVGHQQDIFYLWRPILRDPKDDMLLELAVAAACDAIVTYNVRDFGGAEKFGIQILTPYEFLILLGEAT